MRRYETIIILRSSTGEEEINRVIDYTTGIISSEKGIVIELSKWGIKKLAYLIKKESMGYYIFFDYASEPAAVAEMERRFRIDDSVIKYLTVKIEDDIDESGAKEAITNVSERLAAEAEEAAKAEEAEKTESQSNGASEDNAEPTEAESDKADA